MEVFNDAEEQALYKTNRINLLLDFYGSLLTDKQLTFMQQYFYEDFSLGEIAEAFEISRQAVYEHIKRSGQMLDEYEMKLRLLEKHEQRQDYLHQLQELLQEHPQAHACRIILDKLSQVD